MVPLGWNGRVLVDPINPNANAPGALQYIFTCQKVDAVLTFWEGRRRGDTSLETLEVMVLCYPTSTK